MSRSLLATVHRDPEKPGSVAQFVSCYWTNTHKKAQDPLQDTGPLGLPHLSEAAAFCSQGKLFWQGEFKDPLRPGDSAKFTGPSALSKATLCYGSHWTQLGIMALHCGLDSSAPPQLSRICPLQPPCSSLWWGLSIQEGLLPLSGGASKGYAD